jgi:hypothetical protein
VRLDRTEELLPADATEFASRCTLCFVEHGKSQRVADRVEVKRLGGRDAAPYVFAAAGVGEVPCTAYTRPHDRRPADLRLAADDGFALPLRDEQDVRGNASQSDEPGVYKGTAVYYDYLPGRLVSYWFFYAGSALPALISQRLLGHNRARAAGPLETTTLAPSSPAAAAEDAAARYALLETHPELFSLVVEDRFESFGFADLWDKLDTFVTAIGRDTYLCHQGDWEHVTVFLDPKNELGDPLSVGFAAHGKKSSVAWADVDQEDGRLVVYSGLGSHASMPKPGYNWETGDFSDANGLRWRTWEQVEPVRQSWWGYGGAWGRAGEVGDLTGPLGPSPYKDPPAPSS